MQIALKCVLPRAVGGSESSLVYYDNDFKFDCFRFKHLIRAKLLSLLQEFEDNDERQRPETTSIATTTMSTTTSNATTTTSRNALSEADLNFVVDLCLQRFFVIRYAPLLQHSVSNLLAEFAHLSLSHFGCLFVCLDVKIFWISYSV